MRFDGRGSDFARGARPAGEPRSDEEYEIIRAGFR